MGAIGWFFGSLCWVPGWFGPMYAAGRLEAMNVGQYETARTDAETLGLTAMVVELEAMRVEELRHEAFFGAMVRATTMSPFQPGQTGVGMAEEGFEEVDAVDLIEAFCRHLMLGVSRWQEEGAKAAARRWLDRLEKMVGVRHGIEPNGDLIATSQHGAERRSLVEALAKVDWLDRESGAPKL